MVKSLLELHHHARAIYRNFPLSLQDAQLRIQSTISSSFPATSTSKRLLCASLSNTPASSILHREIVNGYTPTDTDWLLCMYNTTPQSARLLAKQYSLISPTGRMSPDVLAAYISAHTPEPGHSRRFQRIDHVLASHGIGMTLSLFTALASVTAAAGRYNECLSILDDARMKYGGNPDIRVYRSVLQALCQSDFGARLVIDRVFIEALRDGEVDLYCWEALVAAYVVRGDGPQVLRCVKEMAEIEGGKLSVFGGEALEKVGMSDLWGKKGKRVEVGRRTVDRHASLSAFLD